MANSLSGEADPLPLSSGAFNVTAKNLSRAIKAAGTAGLYLGFSAGSCAYCAVHEPQYSAYDAVAATHAKLLPRFARVNTDRERVLASRYEVAELPAAVLAFGDRWVHYKGRHTPAAMAAFGVTHASKKPSQPVRSEAALRKLLERGAAADVLEAAAATAEPDEQRPPPALGRQEHELLMLGFFKDPEGDDEDALEDFVGAVKALRRERTDAAVRAAHVTLTEPLLHEYGKVRRWFDKPPAVVLLVGGEEAPSGGAYALDERDDDNLDLARWAARAALPLLAELTPLNFAAYAGSGLPMLLGFVDVAADNRALLAAMRAVAARYRGRVVAGWLDGEKHRARMLSLGLREGKLPQLAFNVKDGRQLPYPFDEMGAPTEAALSVWAGRFLGDSLRAAPVSIPSRGPMKQPENWTPKPGEAELVVEIEPATFDAVAMDATRDVLLQLYASEGCEPCVGLVMFYNRLAGRVAEMGVNSTLTIARLDVFRHQLPAHLKDVQLHSLPLLLMLPARRKEPPFRLFHGRAKTKELLYFAREHATHRFELPPNPHLSREQQDAWVEQVGAMATEKREAAFDTLQQETGLSRAELGLPERPPSDTPAGPKSEL